MKTITHKELVATVAEKAGAMPVGIVATVDAKLLKTGNPFGTVAKRVRAVGFVGAKYGASVAREGERQGVDASQFEASSLPWGQWLVANKVIAHKGAMYLRTQSTPGQRQRQPAKVLAYVGGNGQRLTHEQVSPFLPAKSVSRKQTEVGLDESKQIDVRTYAFASIERVRVGGQTYRLVP